MTDEIQKKQSADPTFEHRRGRDRKPESGREEREEWVWILDYLPYGRDTDNRPVYQKKPLIHALGDNKLILMELWPAEGKIPPLHIKTFLDNKTEGADGEKYIERVKSRISYDELSNGAKMDLPVVLEEYVKINEQKFIPFFSKADPLSMRQNSLELLPGIGKKLMLDILEESKKGPFKGYEDLKARVPALYNPEKQIVQRIIEELKSPQKYYIFTAPPSRALMQAAEGGGQLRHGGRQGGPGSQGGPGRRDSYGG
ncbi:MAG: DUF655 domain-containing protein, partial [Methanimicrococcus sp.]|nr:DUF655 domain-containing protein [Methanimicrococcus sp.]